jgi:hypothetical protein
MVLLYVYKPVHGCKPPAKRLQPGFFYFPFFNLRVPQSSSMHFEKIFKIRGMFFP